jgi:hypothetical protein
LVMRMIELDIFLADVRADARFGDDTADRLERELHAIDLDADGSVTALQHYEALMWLLRSSRPLARKVAGLEAYLAVKAMARAELARCGGQVPT